MRELCYEHFYTRSSKRGYRVRLTKYGRESIIRINWGDERPVNLFAKLVRFVGEIKILADKTVRFRLGIFKQRNVIRKYYIDN